MKFLFHSLFLFLFFAPSSFAAGSASLLLSPTTGTYPIGEVFVVSVNINTNGEKISTAEGKINFNNEELEVTAVSKNDSILTSWDNEPTYSNKEGIISFAGLTTAGYSGESGKILSVSFKALKNKASIVRFATGAAVIAADELGTNILTSMDAAQYELTPKEIVPSLKSTTPVAEATTSPEASVPFEITSPTHPDQTRYYSTTTATFLWKWKSDISSVSFLLDDKPTTTPRKIYTSPVTEKTFRNLSEGVSYFHFVLKSKTGSSTLLHYRIGVDMTPPEKFDISEASITDAYGFSFDSTDTVSGIEKYEVKIDEGGEISWKDDGNHIFKPEGLASGTHSLGVKALDFAGNFVTKIFPFTVPVTEAPTFTEKPKGITTGDPFVLRFKASPNAKVTVSIEKEGGSKNGGEATKGSDGIFTFKFADKAEKGKYTVYATAQLKGVDSSVSEKETVVVSGGIVYFAKVIFNFLIAWAPKIFPVALVLLALLWVWSKMSKKKTDRPAPINVAPQSRSPQQQPPTRQNQMREIRPAVEHKEPVRIIAEPSHDTAFQVRIGKKQ